MKKCKMKKYSRVLMLVLVLIIAVAILPVSVTEAKSNVKLNKTKVTLNVGGTVQLKVKGTNKKVTWSSSNKSIATVSRSGKVKAKKVGTVTITAKVSGKKYKCKVTVKYKDLKDIKVLVNGKKFTLTLYDNASGRQFLKKLPLTISMKELNGNEKYYYMDSKFKTKAIKPAGIHTGDFMLYGSNCLVLFYKNFKTSYSYTPLGYMKNAKGFAKAVGKGNVKVTFSSGKDTADDSNNTSESEEMEENNETQKEETETEKGEVENINIKITVGDEVFSAKLYNNVTAKAFIEKLPMTLNMNELNGNEKYYYLSDSLPVDSQRQESIHTGELMLYGANCLVLFYDSFSTSYSYTPLGSVDNPTGLAEALGSGNVQVTFHYE